MFGFSVLYTRIDQALIKVIPILLNGFVGYFSLEMGVYVTVYSLLINFFFFFVLMLYSKSTVLLKVISNFRLNEFEDCFLNML